MNLQPARRGSNSASFQIRKAVPADLGRIMQLSRESATAAQWSEEQYRSIFYAQNVCRVALVAEDTRVQGFLVGRCSGGECEIENVVVTPQKRRLGAGASLLAKLIQTVRLEGVESIFLEVRESNLPARALYEKAGFAVNGRRSRYYQNPEEDAAVYRLKLGESE